MALFCARSGLPAGRQGCSPDTCPERSRRVVLGKHFNSSISKHNPPTLNLKLNYL